MPAIQYSQELMDLRQYESMPEEQRMEVFDGIAYNMASPSQLHQSILTELLVSLRNYIRKNNGGCSVFPAPFDVKLNDSPLTIVQPDLMIVCDRDKLDGKRCNGAPDFIIEIVSPSSQRMDYLTKLLKYRSAGVREYWIVNPADKTLFIYVLKENQFIGMHPLIEEDSIQSKLFPDLDFQLAEIFN